jgi:hypothetical protein
MTLIKCKWHNLADVIDRPALFESCPVCGGLTYGRQTGVLGRRHNACFTAVDRWVRPRVADTTRQAAQ